MRNNLKWLVIGPMFLALGCSGDSSEGVLPGVEALVFVKRTFERPDGTHNVAGGANQTIDYLRYEPGGGLFVLTPPTPDGELRNLTESFEGVDVNGVDLSFDATELVFSMRHGGDNHYHIYVANLDGSDVRQLTFGDYDDVKPIWVPGDRVAFMTNQPFTAMGTRADEYNHSRVVTQIATISSVTGDADRRLCSQNLSHSADPFLLTDGRVGFSRWEHLGPVNDVKLFAMNPDCTQMVALAGQHGKPGNSLVQMAEIESGRYVGITTSRERTIQSGAVVQVDIRALEGTTGIAFDEQNARFELITDAVPTGEGRPESGVGRYRRPVPLDEERLLVSWSDGDVNDRNETADTAPNFGIYLLQRNSFGELRRTLVYDDPTTWDLYATPVRVRDIPPVHPGVVAPAPDPTTPAVIGSVDVTITSLQESVSGGPWDGRSLSEALGNTKRVRIIEGFSSEIGPVREFGMTMHEGAAIVGEATVHEDGSWAAEVPPFLPYHLQPIDEFGLAIRNQMLWIQAMPGEDRRCGGCHEARTDTVLPREGVTTLAQQLEPENFNNEIADRLELPWMGATSTTNVQDLFNAKCVSCHDGGANDPFAGMSYTVEFEVEGQDMPLVVEIPYLDLSDRLLQVIYDEELVSYPASYVTLLFPSDMMGDATDAIIATDAMPPNWVVPGAARESVLISKVNAVSEEDGTRWAWETMPHPEDQGVTLTRAERLMLIQMADLGGQYYSRRNVEGADALLANQY